MLVPTLQPPPCCQPYPVLRAEDLWGSASHLLPRVQDRDLLQRLLALQDLVLRLYGVFPQAPSLALILGVPRAVALSQTLALVVALALADIASSPAACSDQRPSHWPVCVPRPVHRPDASSDLDPATSLDLGPTTSPGSAPCLIPSLRSDPITA